MFSAFPTAEINAHTGTGFRIKCIKIRRLSPMFDYEDEKPKKVPKKVYMIIDGEKHYIDPELVERYGLEKQKVSFFTGRKLYVEED